MIGLAGRLQGVDLRLPGDVRRLARGTTVRIDVPPRQCLLHSLMLFPAAVYTHSSDI